MNVMKKIMMMMVMMLTIVVSASGNNNTHRDRKCHVSIEQKCYMDHARHCRCKCHNRSWRATDNKTCKTCRKHIKKMQKQHEKHIREMRRHCGHARR